MIARPHETPSISPCCLVVDDEPRLRQAMVHLMRAEGFQCIEAANGVEALEQLGRHSVALMLSDLRMPKMGGLELLRESRQLYPDLAVVMITAVADVEVAVSCLAGGATDYVVKPYQLEDVRARVARALDKRRLLLENRARIAESQRTASESRRGRNGELFLASVQSLAEALEAQGSIHSRTSIRVSK
jgi:putative two-component system response regulator